jgi:hypothetical protein
MFNRVSEISRSAEYKALPYSLGLSVESLDLHPAMFLFLSLKAHFVEIQP